QLGKMVGLDNQPFGQLAVAENPHSISGPSRQPGFAQGILIDHIPIGKGFVQGADVNNMKLAIPSAMAKTALWDAAKQRHLSALKRWRRHVGAGTGVLALAAARGRLAVAAANTPTNSLLAFQLMHAVMDGRQIHYKVTPRNRATSSRVRNRSKPSMVALTRLMGFV